MGTNPRDYQDPAKRRSRLRGLDQQGRRCDAHERDCTQKAVIRFVVRDPDTKGEIIKQSCSYHPRYFADRFDIVSESRPWAVVNAS